MQTSQNCQTRRIQLDSHKHNKGFHVAIKDKEVFVLYFAVISSYKVMSNYILSVIYCLLTSPHRQRFNKSLKGVFVIEPIRP